MGTDLTDNELKQWAPCCWYLLHILAFKMKNGEIQKPAKCLELFQSLGNILPCPKCQKHFKEYYKKNKITKDTNLVTWTNRYHNDVNRLTNKPLLTDKDIRNLFYVDDDIPIDHKKIHLMLRIFHIFHHEEGNPKEFNKFLRLLRKVFPCNTCKIELKENKEDGFKKFLKIVSGKICQEEKNSASAISKQKFTIS